jgi:hypothetical protein
MSEDKGKIYDKISRLPKVSNEALAEIFMIIQEATKEIPNISKYYVEPKFDTDDRLSSGHFRYEQYVHDVQKWQQTWLGLTKHKSTRA